MWPGAIGRRGYSGLLALRTERNKKLFRNKVRERRNKCIATFVTSALLVVTRSFLGTRSRIRIGRRTLLGAVGSGEDERSVVSAFTGERRNRPHRVPTRHQVHWQVHWWVPLGRKATGYRYVQWYDDRFPRASRIVPEFKTYVLLGMKVFRWLSENFRDHIAIVLVIERPQTVDLGSKLMRPICFVLTEEERLASGVVASAS